MEPDETTPPALAVYAADQGGGYERFIGDVPDHDPFTDYPDRSPFDLSLFVAPMGTGASLAHNLDVRRQKIWDCWGTSVAVGWIGNEAHQAECSDHNKDATGVVHAIDPMVTGARAQAIVAQVLRAPDLQYVIHNRVIWSVNTNWSARTYTGTDPHTNHVHISGKHGGAHRNSATCTGYNLVAQAATPTFNICPQEEDPDMAAVDLSDATIAKLAAATGKAVVDELLTRDLGKPGGGDTVGIVLQSGVLGNSNRIVAQLDEIAAKLTPGE